MSEMVERVAKALAIYQFNSPTAWEDQIPMARAAVEAMRPSHEFIWEAVYNLRPMLNCIRGHDLTGEEAYRIFNAVIDAALRGGGLYGAGGGGGAGPSSAAGGERIGPGIIELHCIPKDGGAA